jgi:hypothetical protein
LSGWYQQQVAVLHSLEHDASDTSGRVHADDPCSPVLTRIDMHPVGVARGVASPVLRALRHVAADGAIVVVAAPASWDLRAKRYERIRDTGPVRASSDRQEEDED